MRQAVVLAVVFGLVGVWLGWAVHESIVRAAIGALAGGAAGWMMAGSVGHVRRLRA